MTITTHNKSVVSIKNNRSVISKKFEKELSKINEIIRALAAIKGQQSYYGYNAKKIDKEGIVLTSRNADAVVKALEKQITKKVYHFLEDDIFECENWEGKD